MTLSVENLQVGDTVSLRSGGPVMTVMQVMKTAKMVACLWHDGAPPQNQKAIDSGGFNEWNFDPATLRKHEGVIQET